MCTTNKRWWWWIGNLWVHLALKWPIWAEVSHTNVPEPSVPSPPLIKKSTFWIMDFLILGAVFVTYFNSEASLTSFLGSWKKEKIEITWKIFDSGKPFSPISSRCNLFKKETFCLGHNYFISFYSILFFLFYFILFYFISLFLF